MLKICHVVDELGIGGLEKIVISIVLNLKGYEHQVWCLKIKGVLAREIEDRGIIVREFNFSGGLKLSSIYKLKRELKKGNFNVVHCHGAYPSIWGRLAAILSGIKARVVEFQNLDIKLPLKDRLKLRILSHFTSKIIAVSKAVKKSQVEFMGAAPKRVTVIYNGAPDLKVDIEINTRLKLREEFGIKKDDFVVGSISRLVELKGFSYLIEAISRLACYIPNLKCLIVGDGPARKDLEVMVEALGIKDKVIFSGYRLDIANCLSTMEVFVLASTWTEGLALCLAEAASFALPLIGTNIGGIPEIVLDGVNGFIVPARNSEAIAEKIKFFIENAAERKKMGENSRKVWQDKFTLEEMIEKIDSLYKSLCL